MTASQENIKNLLEIHVRTEHDKDNVIYYVKEEDLYYPASEGFTQTFVFINTDESRSLTKGPQHMSVDSDTIIQTTLLPESKTGELVVRQQDDSGEEVQLQPNCVNIDGTIETKSQTIDNNIEEVDIAENPKRKDAFRFEEKGGQSDHEKRQGSENEDPQLKPKVNHNLNTVKRKFSCSFCSYASSRRYLLLQHMNSHTNVRLHICTICERGFKTSASLQNHINMHNKIKPHNCKYCSNSFTTSGELVRHVRYRHTHEKPHKCTECDYAAVELSKLRRHVYCHTGERPYQCDHCTYASSDTFKLKRHLRTHTGEKPYKCDNCNMCFTQSNSLKSHKRLHNLQDMSVYKCELCSTEYRYKDSLQKHVQKLHTSNKLLYCKLCGKFFPDRYSLKMHKINKGEKHINNNSECVQKTQKEKTHMCQVCQRSFTSKGYLIRHLATHNLYLDRQEEALALETGTRLECVQTNPEKIEEKSEIKIEQTENNINDSNCDEVVTLVDCDGQDYIVIEII